MAARILAPADRFGPWADNLPTAERRARLRAMRMAAHLHAGPRASTLCQHLAAAEFDPGAMVPALDSLDSLTPVDRRRILASYAALHQPPQGGTRP